MSEQKSVKVSRGELERILDKMRLSHNDIDGCLEAPEVIRNLTQTFTGFRFNGENTLSACVRNGDGFEREIDACGVIFGRLKAAFVSFDHVITFSENPRSAGMQARKAIIKLYNSDYRGVLVFSFGGNGAPRFKCSVCMEGYDWNGRLLIRDASLCSRVVVSGRDLSCFEGMGIEEIVDSIVQDRKPVLVS